MSDPETQPEPPARPLLTLAGLSWLLLAIVELLLMAAIPLSALHRRDLPGLARASLVCLDLLALALLAAPLGALAGLARWSLPGLPSRARALLRVLSALTAWLVLGLGLASWVGLAKTGMFLDHEGLLAWAPHPAWAVRFIHPLLVLAVPLGALGLALLVNLALPAWAERRGPPWPGRLLGLALLALGGCQLLFLAGRAVPGSEGELVVDEAAGTTRYSDAVEYIDAQKTAAGAYAHALLDLRGWLLPAQDALQVAGDLEVVHRPLVPLEEFLKAAPGVPGRRPSVVLVEVESLRSDRLRAYGGTREVMPHLDALASEALRFRAAYTTAPQTNYAAVSPLSSQYPLRSSRMYIYPNPIPYPHVMLYDVLKGLGYRVGLFSSQDDSWGSMDNYTRTPSVDVFFQPATFMASQEGQKEGSGFERAKARPLEGGCLDDRFTVREGLAWATAEPARPFFLYLNLQISHFPYTLPEDARHRFGPEKVDFPMSYAYYPPEKAEAVQGLYDDALSYVDEQLGKLFAGLKAQGRWDDTVVVVTGDHGEAFGEHGLLCHANGLYEEAVRVPLLIKAAQGAPGGAARFVDVPNQLIDVPPTVHHLLGLPSHPDYQGVDLLGPVPAGRDLFLVVHSPIGHQYGLVQGSDKLILDKDTDQTLLFDLAADPGERHNLATSQPGRAQALRARLDSWRAAQLSYYGDPLQQSLSYPPVLAERPR